MTQPVFALGFELGAGGLKTPEYIVLLPLKGLCNNLESMGGRRICVSDLGEGAVHTLAGAAPTSSQLAR